MACSADATRNVAGGAGHPIKLAEAVAEEAERHPGATIEVFATDEHRIGLKPVLRRVWAPRGDRPIARGHHRFEWLYVTAFVSPATGESFWYLSNTVDKVLFAEILALFAREVGAGCERIVVLVLDGADWHPKPGLAVPEGIRLVHLPPYSPELQPAETLWVHVDEPIANRHFETLADLDAAVATKCVAMNQDRELVQGEAGFNWWPARVEPSESTGVGIRGRINLNWSVDRFARALDETAAAEPVWTVRKLSRPLCYCSRKARVN